MAQTLTQENNQNISNKLLSGNQACWNIFHSSMGIVPLKPPFMIGISQLAMLIAGWYHLFQRKVQGRHVFAGHGKHH